MAGRFLHSFCRCPPLPLPTWRISCCLVLHPCCAACPRSLSTSVSSSCCPGLLSLPSLLCFLLRGLLFSPVWWSGGLPAAPSQLGSPHPIVVTIWKNRCLLLPPRSFSARHSFALRNVRVPWMYAPSDKLRPLRTRHIDVSAKMSQSHPLPVRRCHPSCHRWPSSSLPSAVSLGITTLTYFSDTLRHFLLLTRKPMESHSSIGLVLIVTLTKFQRFPFAFTGMYNSSWALPLDPVAPCSYVPHQTCRDPSGWVHTVIYPLGVS